MVSGMNVIPARDRDMPEALQTSRYLSKGSVAHIATLQQTLLCNFKLRLYWLGRQLF
jgi:hypothetical protein